MQWLQRIPVQTAIVVVLFLGSLTALLVNTFAPLSQPQVESDARHQLRAASERMGEAAERLAFDLPAGSAPPADDLNRALREVASQVLTDYPNVEGGFYLADSNRFAGFAFPTGPQGDLPHRNEPPPLEAPYLRLLAQQSLDLEAGEVKMNVQDVGPSRVVMLTEPVGRQRPARLATWLLYRVTGPEQLTSKAHRYAFSSTLALGGIVLSLALTWNLQRTLRRQRQEQEQLRDSLRHSEHLAALGRLLAGVAHEVRNPLAGIRSTVQLWQRLPQDARTPESMDAVVGAVDRLDAIVSRLLFFARADKGERQAVALNPIVGEMLDLLAAQADNQGVVLERDLAADLPAIIGSSRALQQVILNLLTNAMQAMPNSGRLRCSTRCVGSTVEFRVADTGCGVALEVREHLFEPFVTGRADGTGLGLALCREIVHHHGGRIELESTSPAGSTFRVLLPVAS